MLVFAFQSGIWIVQYFNFTAFEDFCLSLSWKYRFSQNVNHSKVQSKTNKFHVDPTRRRLSKNRFLKLGMVPKELYRNTIREEAVIGTNRHEEVSVGERQNERQKRTRETGQVQKVNE